MTKFALFPVLLFLFFSAKAQDRIININHDTIQCTVLSINNEQISYELKNPDGSVTVKYMNLPEVSEYTSRIQPENKLKPRMQKTSKPEKVWCLGLNIGGSTLPWYLDSFQSSASMPDYYSKLKTGFHINTSAHYMINGFLGLGVEYSFFMTSYSGTMPTQVSPSINLMESEKYRQYSNYLGPSVLFLQHLDQRRKFILSESLSAGILFFRMEDQNTYPYIDNSGYTDITNNSLLTASSLSGKLSLTAEYRLFRNVSVGIGSDYIMCSIKKANFETKGPNETSSSMENQELTKAIKLSRIDYSFVLHFLF